MNEFNIITTYYNNKELLLMFIDGYLHHKKQFPFLKLIIVDDGSQEYPAADFLNKDEIPDCSLYRVTVDLGFNSHGCRNLAMQQSDKHWNLLLDSDIDLKNINLELLVNYYVGDNDVIDLWVNSLYINKKVFFSCKGYDEEFVNVHVGDKLFIQYLKDNFYYETWRGTYGGINVIHTRKGRKTIYTDEVKITTYDDLKRKLFHPYPTNLKQLQTIVKQRYNNLDFSTKQIITFPWEKVW